MSNPTPLDIPRLRELAAKATKRPWKAGRTDMLSYLGDGSPVHYLYRGDAETADSRVQFVEYPGGDSDPTDDALFVAALANSADALLALAERAEAMEKALREIRDDFDCDADAHRYNTTCRACLARTALESRP